MTDSQCSKRGDDWARFLLALVGHNTDKRRSPCPVINYVLKVGHNLKNIIVEELRRWRGECG